MFYFSSDFQEFLRKEGIVHKTSVAYVPQSNGKAERLNRTLLEKASTMMATTNLPFYMWGSAILAANYLRNRTPCKSINFKTSFELMFNKLPEIRHLRIFGCTAYPLIMTKRNKFEPTAQANCILAGFDDSDGIYWIYNRTTRKMFRSRDVKFNESFTNEHDKPNNTRNGEEWVSLDYNEVLKPSSETEGESEISNTNDSSDEENNITTDLEDEQENLRAPVDSTKYRQAIGKLMYLMKCSRPDICYSVLVLSRFMTELREKHWRYVKHLLKYVKTTRDYALIYPKLRS